MKTKQKIQARRNEKNSRERCAIKRNDMNISTL